MPRSTRLLAIATAVLSALWAWAWLGLDWTLALPASPRQYVMTTPPPPLQADVQPPPPVDPAPFLRQPAFYPDRRMHPYRPGAEGEAIAPKTTLDFELTTTVVTRKRAFAVLRLRGGGTSVIARPGEAFEADPAWQVTRIDRTSASFVNAQGTPLTLTIKSPATVQQAIATAPHPMPVPPGSPPSTPSPAFAQAPQLPAQAPVTATQPAQENADIRARIEARRRESEARAQPARTQ